MYSKTIFIDQMLIQIDDKIQMIEGAIRTAKESRDSEDKSSAGDKYETGRAMMHIEIQNKTVQLGNAAEIKKTLKAIDVELESDAVTFGSLVKTNNGLYFISVALGLIKTDGDSCFAISMASPLGRIFKDKKVGEEFQFNGKLYQILDVS